MFRWDKVSVPKKLGRKLFVANAVLFAGSFGVLLWMRKSSFVTCLCLRIAAASHTVCCVLLRVRECARPYSHLPPQLQWYSWV
jgi:hypothetical protein